MSENRREKNRREGGRLRRADICLVAFFLLLALGGFVWSAVSLREGQSLQISCDGVVIEKVALAQMKRHDPVWAERLTLH